MDCLAQLEDHLSFIQRFYNAAAEPFESAKWKIESEEEPFTPRYSPGAHAGHEYQDEWNEADQCLRVLGGCALGLLAKALGDYLREFVIREQQWKKDPKELSEILNRYTGSWFEKYCLFLTGETAFDWEQCPVTKGQIEQINLSRNDFVHDETLGGSWPLQSPTHFKKYPVSSFADDPLGSSLRANGKPELPEHIRVTAKALTTHIDIVRQFCNYVETSGTNRIIRQLSDLIES